jgi:hypothetical protein
MGNFALPAANFLREMNNMLYRERESAKRHDEAMGNIGLRTATFKYQMEQDRQARQDRQAARQLQQKNLKFQQQLQTDAAARAQAMHKAQIEDINYKLEEERKLRTPAPFSAYNLIPKTDPLWQNEEFVADMERQFSGKLNKESGGFIGDKGKDMLYAPIKLKDKAPAIIGVARMYKDGLSDTLMNIQDMGSKIADLDTKYKNADPRNKHRKTQLANERSALIKQQSDLQKTLTPTNILGHYRKEKDDFNRLALWASGKGLKELEGRFRTQADQNAKLEIETVSKILAKQRGGEAVLKMAYDPLDPNFRVHAAVHKQGFSTAPVVNGRQLVWGTPSSAKPNDFGKYAAQFGPSSAKPNDFGKYAAQFGADQVLPASGPNMVKALPQQVAASQAIQKRVSKLIEKHGTPRTEGEAQRFGVAASDFIIKRHGQLLALKAEIETDTEIGDEQRNKELKQWEADARKLLGYIPKGELRLSARSRIEE